MLFSAMNKEQIVVGLTLNYRDAARTTECVRSLLDNNANHVLVWDNSEDNGTSAREIEQKLRHDHRVNIEISPINTGFALGVNLSIEKIRLSYPDAQILLINNDAKLLPDAIPALVKALKEHPDAVLAYPSIRHSDIVIGKIYYHRLTGMLTTSHLPGSFRYPSGCCMLISLNRLTTQLFDECFFMYGEDWYTGLQMTTQKMAHLSKTLVLHEGSASSKQGSSFYEDRLAAAHWLMAKKLASGKLELFFLYLFRISALGSRALLRSIRFKSTTPLRALYTGWLIAHGHDSVHERALSVFRSSSGTISSEASQEK